MPAQTSVQAIFYGLRGLMRTLTTDTSRPSGPMKFEEPGTLRTRLDGLALQAAPPPKGLFITQHRTENIGR